MELAKIDNNVIYYCAKTGDIRSVFVDKRIQKMRCLRPKVYDKIFLQTKELR